MPLCVRKVGRNQSGGLGLRRRAAGSADCVCRRQLTGTSFASPDSAGQAGGSEAAPAPPLTLLLQHPSVRFLENLHLVSHASPLASEPGEEPRQDLRWPEAGTLPPSDEPAPDGGAHQNASAHRPAQAETQVSGAEDAHSAGEDAGLDRRRLPAEPAAVDGGSGRLHWETDQGAGSPAPSRSAPASDGRAAVLAGGEEHGDEGKGEAVQPLSPVLQTTTCSSIFESFLSEADGPARADQMALAGAELDAVADAPLRCDWERAHELLGIGLALQHRASQRLPPVRELQVA